LDLSREYKERGHEAWTLWLLGEIAGYVTPLDSVQAEIYYRQALALAEELAMRPLVANCHLGLGRLYQCIGLAERADTELTVAANMYRAMEMPFWLEKAETTPA
jgi:hypothetical protein